MCLRWQCRQHHPPPRHTPTYRNLIDVIMRGEDLRAHLNCNKQINCASRRPASSRLLAARVPGEAELTAHCGRCLRRTAQPPPAGRTPSFGSPKWLHPGTKRSILSDSRERFSYSEFLEVARYKRKRTPRHMAWNNPTGKGFLEVEQLRTLQMRASSTNLYSNDSCSGELVNDLNVERWSLLVRRRQQVAAYRT